jgi:hypothetical protein
LFVAWTGAVWTALKAPPPPPPPPVLLLLLLLLLLLRFCDLAG